MTQALFRPGHDYVEGVEVLGNGADTGRRAVTILPRHFTKGT